MDSLYGESSLSMKPDLGVREDKACGCHWKSSLTRRSCLLGKGSDALTQSECLQTLACPAPTYMVTSLGRKTTHPTTVCWCQPSPGKALTSYSNSPTGLIYCQHLGILKHYGNWSTVLAGYSLIRKPRERMGTERSKEHNDHDKA